MADSGQPCTNTLAIMSFRLIAIRLDHCFFNCLHEGARWKWFSEICDATAVKCGFSDCLAVVPSNVDDRSENARSGQLASKLNSRFALQIDIHDDACGIV